MARLQDFQTVTPSSSNDNLLIVQAAGQGLAKIDAVGQKIATDTTISSLNTTSKKIAGAINEIDGKTDNDISHYTGTPTAGSTAYAIGDLTNLTTTNKSSAVSAINEVNGKFAYLSKMCTKITLNANATKTITVTQDSSSRVGFIVYAQGAQGNLSPIMYLVGGYVTASRCSVTNISGKTGITINSSSTSNLNFGFTNTTGITVDLFFLPLFDNTFT